MCAATVATFGTSGLTHMNVKADTEAQAPNLQMLQATDLNLKQRITELKSHRHASKVKRDQLASLRTQDANVESQITSIQAKQQSEAAARSAAASFAAAASSAAAASQAAAQSAAASQAAASSAAASQAAAQSAAADSNYTLSDVDTTNSPDDSGKWSVGDPNGDDGDNDVDPDTDDLGDDGSDSSAKTLPQAGEEDTSAMSVAGMAIAGVIALAEMLGLKHKRQEVPNKTTNQLK